MRYFDRLEYRVARRPGGEGAERSSNLCCRPQPTQDRDSDSLTGSQLCCHETEMRRVLVAVILALQPGAARQIGKCDNVAQLSDLKGEIYAVGGADASEPCGWHIYPDRRLQRMEFRVNESSRLEGSDQLSFYSYNVQHETALVGRFTVYEPVSAELELRGAAAWPKVPGSQ